MPDDILNAETAPEPVAAPVPAPVEAPKPTPKKVVVEAPCTLRWNAESGRVSLGCTTHDLESFIEGVLEAHE